MPLLFITTRSGEDRTVATENYRTVMEAIRGDGIEELEALCGGCCSCGTCHVYVDPASAAQLPPMGDDEDMLLEGSMHRREGLSRLSCQLPAGDLPDGLRLTVAPAE